MNELHLMLLSRTISPLEVDKKYFINYKYGKITVGFTLYDILLKITRMLEINGWIPKNDKQFHFVFCLYLISCVVLTLCLPNYIVLWMNENYFIIILIFLLKHFAKLSHTFAYEFKIWWINWNCISSKFVILKLLYSYTCTRETIFFKKHIEWNSSINTIIIMIRNWYLPRHILGLVKLMLLAITIIIIINVNIKK